MTAINCRMEIKELGVRPLFEHCYGFGAAIVNRSEQLALNLVVRRAKILRGVKVCKSKKFIWTLS